MKVGIIVFPGTNCDRDTEKACKSFDWDVNFIWHDETSLDGYDIIFIPGGFSYGDYIRAGRLAKFSPAILALKEYVQQKTGFVIGICNGFQILCETGLLPGILSVNDSTKLICDVVPLNLHTHNDTLEINLPIAHAEGKYLADKKTLSKIKDDNMIFLTYQNNPNGSLEDIAGLYDRRNKVIGLMPHPERAVFKETGNTTGHHFFQMLANEITTLN